MCLKRRVDSLKVQAAGGAEKNRLLGEKKKHEKVLNMVDYTEHSSGT